MPSSTRLRWVDAARAFSVIVIIVVHLSIWVMPPIYEAYPDLAVWNKALSITGPFRLPVLFVLSGFLVADRVRAGWRDRRNLLRATTSYYLYAVWLAIYALLTAALPGGQPVGVSWQGFLKQLLVPNTPLWFVACLAVSVALFTSLNRVHPAIVLLGTAFISWWSIRTPFPSDFAMVERGLYYLLFFALGVYGKKILTSFGAREGLAWRVPVMLVIAFIGIDTYKNVSMSFAGYFGAILLRDISAVLCIVTVMAALCTVPFVARALTFIGSRTLPLYVMHVPLIWVLVLLRPWYLPAMDIYAVRIATPALILVCIVGMSLLLYAVLTRFAAGRLLFEMPPPLQRTILGKGIERVPGAR